MRRTTAVAGVLALGLLAGATTACASPGDVAPSPTVPQTQEYRPGMPATTRLPDAPATAVAVLVPGGGWSTADPSGLAPLAETLVDAGLAVATITYGTSSSGDAYPVPVDDVACAVSFAAAQVPGVPVVAVGHSAGAHLAVLAALVPDGRAGEGCAHPARPADGVVGLAGPYDVAATGGVAANLFGVPQDQDRDAWTEGNPLTWANERPDLPVLLVHGDADTVVPVRFTDGLADALRAGGHDVQVEVLPGVDHMEVIRPEVVAGSIVRWTAGTVAGRT